MQPVDPRVLLVEDVLGGFARALSARRPDGVTLRSEDGVVAFFSEVPSPVLNQVRCASPAAAHDLDLARVVLDEFVDRRLPWSWTTTPSTTSSALEAFLAQAGLVPTVDVGMHLALTSDLPDGAGRTVVVGGAPDPDFRAVMAEVFGFPAAVVAAVDPVMRALDAGDQITARVLEGDRVVGVAHGVPVDDAVLVINVATLAEARRRGVSTAATARVLAVARDRGIRDAVLVASPDGRGVYRGLGFRDVCDVTTWDWRPRGT